MKPAPWSLLEEKMSRKIMVICGSPRKKGNTNQLVAWFKEGAEGAGAEVEVVNAARLKYKTNGCIACMKCQKSEEYGCTVEDEAQEVLARFPDTDVIVMASPVYWFAPTAQIKLLMDRMFSLIKIDPERGRLTHCMGGKTFGLISTAGGDLENVLRHVEKTFATTADLLGMEFDSFLLPAAPMNPKDLLDQEETKERALAFGRKLAGG
jgi:multimeric flavodoxin WrbA